MAALLGTALGLGRCRRTRETRLPASAAMKLGLAARFLYVGNKDVHLELQKVSAREII